MSAPSVWGTPLADVLRIEHLSKTFPGQVALSDVSISVDAGEVHALVGQNGSGKSTLIKVLSGYHQPDPGASAWANGEPLTLGDGHAAAAAGIRFVHQDLGLVGSLSAVENIALTAGYHVGVRRPDPVARRGAPHPRVARGARARRHRRQGTDQRPAPVPAHRRGDRPRPRRLGGGRPPARARRADGDAAGRRRPPPVRGHPPLEGAGRLDHLRLPPPRRGVRARRPGHGAARRQAGGHGARVRARSPAPRGADRRPPRRDDDRHRGAPERRRTAGDGPRPARWQRARHRLRRLRRRDRRVRRDHGLGARARAAADRRPDPP